MLTKLDQLLLDWDILTNPHIESRPPGKEAFIRAHELLIDIFLEIKKSFRENTPIKGHLRKQGFYWREGGIKVWGFFSGKFFALGFGMGNGGGSGFGINGLRPERRASLLRVPEWLGYYRGLGIFPVVAGACGIH